MAYYVRKIARAKWKVHINSAGNSIYDYRADAIANDMRTQSDTLSFWKVESLEPEDLEPVIVINSLLGDTITKIDLLCVPDTDVVDYSFLQQDGDTVVTNYKQLHFNMVNLTIGNLISFADNVVLKILTNEETQESASNQFPLIKRITEKAQVELVKEWIDKGEINYDDLKIQQKKRLDRI